MLSNLSLLDMRLLLLFFPTKYLAPCRCAVIFWKGKNRFVVLDRFHIKRSSFDTRTISLLVQVEPVCQYCLLRFSSMTPGKVWNTNKHIISASSLYMIVSNARGFNLGSEPA